MSDTLGAIILAGVGLEVMLLIIRAEISDKLDAILKRLDDKGEEGTKL